MKKHVNIEILDEDELVFLNGGTSAAGVDKILKGLKDFIEQLQLSFLGGESMLVGSKVSKIINKVSDFCKSNNIFFSVHFTTNGTMLPKIVLESIRNITTNFFRLQLMDLKISIIKLEAQNHLTLMSEFGNISIL